MYIWVCKRSVFIPKLCLFQDYRGIYCSIIWRRVYSGHSVQELMFFDLVQQRWVEDEPQQIQPCCCKLALGIVCWGSVSVPSSVLGKTLKLHPEEVLASLLRC